eukprot:m.384268 g.384268  ORF g.384268 m.384268 type:complete len:63 (-) comp131614_c0_seq1:17-205(-)
MHVCVRTNTFMAEKPFKWAAYLPTFPVFSTIKVNKDSTLIFSGTLADHAFMKWLDLFFDCTG